MIHDYTGRKISYLHPIEVRRFGFTKSDISIISIKERVLLVQLGRFVNELALFNKLVYISLKHDGFGQIEATAMDSQTQSLLLIMIGKLNEAYEFVKNAFDKSGLKGEYLPIFNETGRIAYDRIKKYFRGKNNINIIRKKLAFHHDSDLIEKQIESCPNDEIFTIFFHEQPGNCYFHVSHKILFKVLASAEGEDIGAIDRLVKEVLDMTGIFMKFFVECIRVFWEEAGGKFKYCDVKEKAYAVNLDEVVLPYFMIARERQNAG